MNNTVVKLTLSLPTHFGHDRHTDIYHAKSRLNTPVWGSLRSPNYAISPRHNVLATTLMSASEYTEYFHEYYIVYGVNLVCTIKMINVNWVVKFGVVR